MAHRLNIGKDGRANMMYYSGEGPVWHGLGTPVDHPATAKEAIEVARLNYTVEKRPMYVGSEQVPEKSATLRTDNGAILGVVGDRYQIVQNTEAFDFFDTLVGEGQAIYTAAGAINKGELIWVMAKLPKQLTLAREDIVEKNLVLVNSHDGSHALKVYFTPVRVICWNTLSASFKDARDGVYIRHSGNIKNKVEEARRVLGISIKWYTEFEELCKQLVSTPITEAKAEEYYDKLIYGNTPEEKKEESAILKNRMQDMMHLFKHGKGNRGETAWDWLNGSTEYYDHGRQIKGETADPTNRLKSIWFGAAAKAKERAFSLALQVAGVN